MGRADRIRSTVMAFALVCCLVASVLAVPDAHAGPPSIQTSNLHSRSLTSDATISVSVQLTADHEQTQQDTAATNSGSACTIRDCKLTHDDVNVCGSDGKTYLNECLFRNAQCRSNDALTRNTNWNGYRCPHTCGHTITCKEIGKYVCGSDGNVYFGYCNLYVAQCVDPSVEEIECPKDMFENMFPQSSRRIHQ
uniref:Kazal-like domain-containing protein n=1 Tax=Globisporangium ultimum (strain ATCC 200006 / CBS 805.95 / DAOM BR144) TaxID=431595 RepID=K3WJ82_GLOUD